MKSQGRRRSEPIGRAPARHVIVMNRVVRNRVCPTSSVGHATHVFLCPPPHHRRAFGHHIPAMALPSSPPLLPEADPPTSPPLPTSDDLGELPIRPSYLSRKRTLSDYGSLSSDPLFSESSEGGIEDAGERRKRKKYIRAPWFKLRGGMAKRSGMRNADSGVFLGSDLSDDSADGTSSSQEEVAELEAGGEVRPGPSQPGRPRSPPQDLASRAINNCLETGHESIDLTGIGLDVLSNATLRPLHQLIKHHHDDLTRPPSEDEFGSLTPSIRLFLSGNRLTSLPSELFRLTNICVLSLRNNQLDHIPHGVGRLRNLQEFNIAQNNITVLPWEMFELVHCRGDHRQITVRPNPLIDPVEHLQDPSPLSRPKVTPNEYNEHLNRWGETGGAFFRKMKQWYSDDETQWTMRHELELRLKLGRLKRTMYMQEASRAGTELKLCKEQLIYLGSSAVRFFDPYRAPLTGDSHLHDHDNEQKYRAVFDPLTDRPDGSDNTNCPSLFESSLRAIQSNFSLLTPNDIPDGLPPAVTAALIRVAKGAEYGNEKCSVCSKEFIFAKAEWVEFWFNGFPAQQYLTAETILPFLRRACS